MGRSNSDVVGGSSGGPPVRGTVAHGTRVTPGPPGVIADSDVDPLAFLGQLIDQYGDVVRYQSRFGPCFVFVHPKHVQTIQHSENYRRASLIKMVLGDGLLASDGPRWLSQRRLMQRDFLPPSVAPFVPVMIRHTNIMANEWLTAARTGDTIDVTTEMTRLTLRIIVEALFSSDLSDGQAADLCAAVTQTIQDLGEISWTIFGAPMHFTPQTNARFATAQNVIDAACYDMVARRRSLPPKNRPRDLLTLLIQADTDDGPLNDRQLRDELVTMLVGGHETTALALAWTWKLLAEHPQVEATLHEELDTALAGRPPALTDLPSLPWTRAVFQETMRLYPPVWYMGRVAIEADVIDNHPIPQGACILISPWFTHRHREFWAEPEQFNPERFRNPAAVPQHRYAYFPFAGGRHQCLGMHLANIEGTVILARLAQQFRVRPLPGQNVRPAPGITLRQSPFMRATVELRPAHAALCPSGGTV